MQKEGLNENQVIKSREKYGENKLSKYKKKSFFKSYVSNLSDPIIRVLIIALIINIAVMFPKINWFESAGIGVSIIIATLVSTVSEYSSENAFERLKEKSESTYCLVRRAGVIKEIPCEEIVVSDIVILSTGAVIPADAQITHGEVYVNESALTGESAEVKKSVGDNALKGSVIVQGECEIEASAVGQSTYYGKIASELAQGTRPSPLKQRLSDLAKTISKIGYLFAGLIAAAYLINVFIIDSGFDFNIALQKVKDVRFLLSRLIAALTLATSIVVVAVPEGLPMMITVVLSSNMKKMLKDNVLVRKLVGIETSGNVNLLFTDKTGTLTEGSLRVKEIYDGYAEKVSLSFKKQSNFEKSLTLCALFCNSSVMSANKALGSNATDRAILEYFSRSALQAKRLDVLPFDSTRKYSACLVNYQGKRISLFKGAPEKLIDSATHILNRNNEQVPISEAERYRLRQRLHMLGAESYRVIALGMKNSDEMTLDNITVIALIAIKDKIRKEVPEAIERVSAAGVGVIMITGDNKETAAQIAKECGIISSFSKREIVLDGYEINEMTDAQIAKILPRVAVICRALPSDKSRLVRIAQENGYIVGMTGDGVNDAPSLKSADVGFAMGSGTDVAKEASDIIITDNNFASIVKAVLYGRTIFESIRKFIIFQLTMNLSAVGISLIGPFIGVDSPVTITQMLWVNIIMDTLGALAFACEPPRREYMQRPPKPRNEKIISRDMVGRILWTGVYVLGLCIWFLKSQSLRKIMTRADDAYILSAFFAAFIFIGVFVCFISRTSRVNILLHISKNKSFLFIMLLISVMQMAFIYFGGELFRAVPLDGKDLLKIILISFTVVVFDFIRKINQLLTKSKNIKRRKNECQTNTFPREA